jgi:hypothetical protein
VPITFGLSEGLTIGRDPATPVTESYQSPFEFTGKIKKVVMELKEDSKQAQTSPVKLMDEREKKSYGKK